MLTTMYDPCEVEVCHKLGCSSYIVKPVDFAKFAEVLSRLARSEILAAGRWLSRQPCRNATTKIKNSHWFVADSSKTTLITRSWHCE